MYFFIHKHTRNRFEVQKSDLNTHHIAQYCEVVYGDGEGGIKLSASNSKMVRQKEVIAFFESKIVEHNIMDFLTKTEFYNKRE